MSPTTRAMRSLLVVALLVGCYRDKHDDEIAQRLTQIERRLDAHDKILADLATRTGTVELTALAKRLADLQQALDQLTAVAQTPAPAPAPAPAKRREPDPAATYAIPVGTSPALGSPKAKVTLVMAMEFDGPDCRRAWDTVDELRKKYGTDLRVVYKPYVVHVKTAMYAAQAACAANRQHKWRRFAELVWAKVFDVRATESDAFAHDKIDALAKEAGVDLARYQQDVAGTCPGEVKDDIALLTKLGVHATPTFYINGRFLEGSKPLADFSTLVDEELAKATAAIKRGIKPERYYEQEIVGKGVPEV